MEHRNHFSLKVALQKSYSLAALFNYRFVATKIHAHITTTNHTLLLLHLHYCISSKKCIREFIALPLDSGTSYQVKLFFFFLLLVICQLQIYSQASVTVLFK